MHDSASWQTELACGGNFGVHWLLARSGKETSRDLCFLLASDRMVEIAWSGPQCILGLLL